MSTQNLQTQTTRIPNRTPTAPGRRPPRDRTNPTERVQRTFSTRNTNRLENLIDDCNSAFVTPSSGSSD
ncbi:hypothetical protein HALLA_17325 [Halostagnicola larsenii XH-48]|uniref:Uncharacterized protein n=1 Tax=Halostagnicola larsenii XH-48 TaxID=797299 RepID=W0JUT8_9EURY|nr:hypothetical protein [Halostagnicola larsenii]AHG01122.1 hypothetical protein HALLA_17325 [Halostagnicola larsenii XH-48]